MMWVLFYLILIIVMSRYVNCKWSIQDTIYDVYNLGEHSGSRQDDDENNENNDADQ